MNKNNRKGIQFIIGSLLVIGTWANPIKQLKYLTNWTGSEMFGYNIWTIGATVGGIYLIYLGIRKTKQ